MPTHVRLYDLLADGQLTVATAESCTGGGVAHRITSVSGSSAYMQGGIVSYSNGAKANLLHVPQAILDNPGAVSAPCAAAMADGARRALGADVAVSTTGIAGPKGGTARKPVGLVYIGTSGPTGASVTEHRFSGDRQTVIAAAIEMAMRQLVAAVEGALSLGIDDASSSP